MDIAALIFGIMWILSGCLLVALARPLVKGEVGMNHWYGVRVRQSFESEEKWLKINRYGGEQLALGGALIILWGALTLFMDLEDEVLLMTSTLVPLAIIVVVAVRSVLYARRA
jgi:uncharacterized membrane protein